LPNSKIIRTAPEAQGESRWIPPVGTLGDLVARAEARSQTLEVATDPAAIVLSRSGVRKLSAALKGELVSVIAEVKRSSPSKGAINPGLDSADQAKAYESGGASAISVLTEPDRFGGSDEDIRRVMSVSSVPVLKKDFHVTTVQLVHAATLGVSAALVIVRALSPSRLRDLAATAREIDLEILFEVRDEWELERAIDLDAKVIGVNNRNLETLQIDPHTVGRLVPLIPSDRIAVAESGYSSRESVETAAAAGADAVLVGSSLSQSAQPIAAVAAIASVPRRRRE
jgi:indole-3-glycerol phosphate synthase